MSKLLTASYQSPVWRYVTQDGVEKLVLDRHEERTLAAVLKCGFDSGSAYCYVHEGDEITRLEGGFFGRFVRYTAVAVEAVQHSPNGPRFPVIVARRADDPHGNLCRLEYGYHMRVTRGAVVASACNVHDGWVHIN